MGDRIKFRINQDFADFSDFIRKIPQDDYPVDKIFCCNRNTVVKTTVNGQSFVVKKYKRPTLFNCFMYTCFRRSKAKRAYRYAGRLLRRGVETPAPVAYIEVKKRGFFHTGYFISEYLPYPTLAAAENLNETEKQWLTEDFIRFTAALHKARMVPKDYNPGNILYYRQNCRFYFALVDINRFDFHNSAMVRCLESFTQLSGLRLTQAVKLVARYCDVRRWDLDRSLRIFLFMWKKNRFKARMKQAVKTFLGILP